MASRNLTNAQSGRESYRDNIIDEYEKELKKARQRAQIIGFLHISSQFLAFCNLTWATVVLLGAFVPSLHPRDFALVTCLLFVEAGRVASASSFLRLFMRPLAYGSQDPKKMKHGEDGQHSASLIVRRVSDATQFVLIVCGIVLPSIGHGLLHDGSYSTTPNLNASLRIFYSFVAFNSLVALITLILFILAFRALNTPQTNKALPEQSTTLNRQQTNQRLPEQSALNGPQTNEILPEQSENLNPEQSALNEPQINKTLPELSILRYFDTVLERAMSSSLIQADVFEFFSFAYTMLGADFRRNMQPEAVAKNNKKLLCYLNAHRLGPDALKTFLEAEDPYVQLAAANMVGFWSATSWGVAVPEKERNLPEDLLRKLADMVGTGQVGWAVTTSFYSLAGTPRGARIVAGTRTSRDVKRPDQLVKLVNASSNRSLSLVRALVRIYEQCCEGEERAPEGLFEEEAELVEKLRMLAEGAEVHRLRVSAAYLLLLIEKGKSTRGVVFAINPEEDPEWFKRVVFAIDPKEDRHWFTSEKEMLELLHSHEPGRPHFEVPTFAGRTQTPFCRDDAGIRTPSWAKPHPLNPVL